MGKDGFYISKAGAITVVVVVVLVLIVEGLLIGLVGRPTCEPYVAVTDPAVPRPTSEGDSTTTTAAATAEGPWTSIRLPDNLVPIEYNVDLRPVLTKNDAGLYMFYGTSTVTYECRKATKYVIMHSRKLNYTKSAISITTGGSPVNVESFDFYEPNEFMIVETEEACSEGEIYDLTVSEFVSELSDDLNGLYRSEYVSSTGVRRVIATSQMEATGARETFPCFDEPALKANFTVTLWYRADTGDFALSNMPPESYKTATIDGEDWTATTFEESVPMSSYLLALVVCDFTYVESFSSTGVQTRIYARTEAVDNGEAVYAAEITPKMLDFFEDYFSVKYPLPKSDQAAVPDFSAGAMENWGLILYRETALLIDDEVSSVFNKRRVTNVVSHELAHQWFGNLVSPAWWDDIWLNEGFASYVSYLGEGEVQPTWKTMERFLLDEVQIAMEVDGLTSSHPLVQPVYSPSEISSQFDDISYSKGASILYMINKFMGEKNFVDGLTTYLNDLAYGAATHDDLFGHWEDQAIKAGLDFPVDLTVILETWTLQMGYPVVNVRKATGTNLYTVTQEYFLFDASAEPVHTEGSKKYGYQWYIPFTYKTFAQIGTMDNSSEWLVPEGEPLTIMESEYILANVDAENYYRVNYDDDTWSKLINRLKAPDFEVISERNRAQLIDDAFNLARPGRLDITTAMTLSQYLTQEQEYVPWRTFMERVKFIEYLIGRSPIYGTFSNYIVQLVEPTLYFKYGFEEPNVDDSAVIERMTIKLAIEGACYYGSEDCIQNATRLYRHWMENPEDSSIISNTYRDDVYCAAIRNGGIDEWNFAWERHNVTSNAQEQTSLRYGMACSKEPWILYRYLEFCIDTNYVRRQDSLRSCMQYIGEEEYGRDVAWAFMVDNWDMLVDIYSNIYVTGGCHHRNMVLKLKSNLNLLNLANHFRYGTGISFDSLIEIITRRFSTEFDLQLVRFTVQVHLVQEFISKLKANSFAVQLEDFKETNTNLGNAVRAVNQAIDRTKANIQWRKLNEDKLTAWLIENTDFTV